MFTKFYFKFLHACQTPTRVLTLTIILAVGYSSFGANAAISVPLNLSEYSFTATVTEDVPTRFLPGDWDGRAVRKSVVIKEGSNYLMWYEGLDYWEVARVGLATSPDGIIWTKYLGNPVLDRGPAAWESSGEMGPFVMFHEGVYKMWYEGSDGSVRQLGYATSPDGITWTKDEGNPVLEAEVGTYDEQAAGHGAVLYESGTYNLWYHAINAGGEATIAYATSPDGVSWTKDSSSPVLERDSGSWEDFGLWGPSVLKVDDTYWMWYAGGALNHTAIGVATSPDGITWEKYPDNPVLSIADNDIGDPTVMLDVETFKMWFNNFTDGQIYYTESDDGTNWSTPEPVLSPGLLEPLKGFHDGSEGEERSTGCSAFGWVVDLDDANRDITVQVLADGVLVEELTADQYRDGIDPLICPDGTCGFALDLWGKITAGVEHTITVQAYDVESEDWWGLEGTPKSLTCWGYPEGSHDGDDGILSYPICNAAGWVYDPDDPSRDMTVQVLVDGEVLDEAIADQSREDVDPLICPEGSCGFVIELADKIALNQLHEIRVQAYNEESDGWLDVPGTPKSLTCQGGRLHLPLLARLERIGDQVSVFESGSQTFPANVPFHVAHGWTFDMPADDYDLFGFELEMDGVDQKLAFIESFIDESSDPPVLRKITVFNFPQGLAGTHIFEGHWLSPCYATNDDCSDPLEILEVSSEVEVTFIP